MADALPASSQYRFSTITPNDHAGYIYIAAFLTFTYSTSTFLARCLIKRKVFGIDDWVACLTQVALIIQFALLLVSLSAGLGKSYGIPLKGEYSRMASFQYANQVFLFLALGLCKLATSMLVRRLFTRDEKLFRMFCNIVAGILVAWTIAAMLLVSVGCSPSGTAPRSPAEICEGLRGRYEAVLVTDIFTEFIVVLLPAYFVCQLQMTNRLKLQVITIFACRLLILPLSVLWLLAVLRSLKAKNPGVARTSAIVLQQSELCLSIIAATLPCLRSFIRSFDTGSGLNVNYSSDAYGSSGRERGQSYQMHSIAQGRSVVSTKSQDKSSLQISRRLFKRETSKNPATFTASADQTSPTAYASGRPVETDSVSYGSQELFIRRDVVFEVRSENVMVSGRNSHAGEEEGTS